MLYTLQVAKVVPFTEARSNLAELLDELQDRDEHILITRNGHPAAVLLSAEEFAALEETLEIVQDEDLMEALKRSAKDVEEGSLVPFEGLTRGAGRAVDGPAHGREPSGEGR